MLYGYKLACEQAGMPTDQIRRIEQIFDTEYKKYRYDRVKRKKYNVKVYHLENIKKDDGPKGSFEVPDPNADLEANFIHRCDLEHLEKILQQLSPEDREFLLDYYKEKRPGIAQLSEKYGMTRSGTYWRKKRLLKLIRGKFFKDTSEK